MRKNYYEIKQTLVYEIGEVAQVIASGVGNALQKEPEGIYLPSQIEPIFIAKQEQGVFKHIKDQHTLEKYFFNDPDYLSKLLEELKRTNEPFFMNGVKIKRSVIESFSLTPYVSLRALDLLKDIVKAIVDQHGVYPKPTRIKKNISQIILEHLNEKVQEQIEYANDVVDKINSLLTDLRIDLRSFLGTDRWITHFVKVTDTDIIVEKSIDYRIAAWMQMQDEKEQDE